MRGEEVEKEKEREKEEEEEEEENFTLENERPTAQIPFAVWG